MVCGWGESDGKCWGENITYQLACTRAPCSNHLTDCPTDRPAPGDDPISLYAGESSRTGYTRGISHIKKYNAKSESEREGSALWRHTRDFHGGVKGPDKGVKDFRMWVRNKWGTPMDRLISEGHDIGELEDSQQEGTVLMLNSKSDFIQSKKVSLEFRQGLN